MKARRLCINVLFVSYKYGGGGYRIWDLVREMVFKVHDVIFFKNGLPQAPLHGTTLCDLGGNDIAIHNSPMLTTTSPAPSTAPTPLALPPASLAPTPSPATTTTASASPPPIDQPPPHLVIRIPAKKDHLPAADVSHHNKSPDNNSGDGANDDALEHTNDRTRNHPMDLERPVHNIALVPDYPKGALWSGKRRFDNDAGGEMSLYRLTLLSSPLVCQAVSSCLISRIRSLCVRLWPHPTLMAGRLLWIRNSKTSTLTTSMS